MANEETTTRFNADISELKQAMQDARRAVRLADSEFKATVSTLENWSTSADGVSAKIKQLNSNVQSQEKILNALEAQYAAVVEEQSKESKAAQELEIKINKQKAVVNQTIMSLQKYETQLGQIVAEQKKMEAEANKQVSAYDKLRETVSQQENELESLKKEYSNTALEQGKTSDAAQELAGQIERLSSELKVNKDLIEKADKAADELDESLDDVGDAAKQAEDGFTIMKGAIASLIADGFKALASAAKDSLSEIVLETGKAYDAFQGKTGTATDAMGEFEDKINELYKSNYGESITDIANAMAEVKQQTQEADPSKLQELTKNALVLRDTFEFDVQESMRAVNMLMTQFGVSGEEAYNLIVQGAQKGLNKNGDLLDTINEYGVHYKQLGYDSDDFFNSLVNGSESGTFSVDKLGDAVKEFGIRVKDTASSTDEGFGLIGLNADKMRKEFAKGGESAQKATQKTLKALFDMDDQVKQNQAGVALFGTMWEDLGVEGVKALMNTNGELTKTKQSMKELDAVSYDNVASKFEEIGRTVKMDLLLPIAEEAIPAIEDFADSAIEHSDSVVTALKAIGAVVATVFVVNKVATFTQSIITMVDAYKKAKTAIQAADAAQKLLNLTQMATPWGAIAAAIGLVVGGLVAYAVATKDAKSETDKLIETVEEENEKIREQAEAYREAEQARFDSLQGIESEYSHYQKLVDELANITDENGKVIKGYEERAAAITGILSQALGTEISTDKLVADGKQKIIDKINKLIETKRAEAMLASQEQAYTTAIQSTTAAYGDYTKAKANADTVSRTLAFAEKELAYLVQKGASALGANAGAYVAAKDRVQKLEEAQKEANQAVKDAQGIYLGYQNTIAAYEGVSAAIIEGDSTKINEALVLMSNGFKTAENATKESLEAQVKTARENLALLQQALKNGEPGITQQMVTNAQIMVDRSVAELDKLAPLASAEGQEGSQAFADGIVSMIGVSENAGKTIAEKAKTGAGSVDSSPTGGDFAQGFINGMEEKESSIWEKAWNLGKKALAALKEAIDSNSPAKETINIGEFFGEGFDIGIESFFKKIGKTSEALGDIALESLAEAVEKSGAVGRRLAQEYAEGMKNGTIALAESTAEASEEFEKAGENNAKSYTQGWMAMMNDQNFHTVGITELLAANKVGDVGELEEKFGKAGFYRMLVNTNDEFREMTNAYEGWTKSYQIKHKDFMDSTGKAFGRQIEVYKDGIRTWTKEIKFAEESTAEAAKSTKKSLVNAASEWLSEQQKLNNLSLADVVAYWDEIRKQCAEGTEERLAADQKYIEAKAKLDDKLIDAAEELQDSLTDIYSKVDNRKKSILDSFDLFGDGTTGDDFYLRLYGQVKGLEQYQNEIDKLESRIGGTGLYEAIKDMGLDAHGQLMQINSMTDHELQEYVKLFDRRSELAENLALDELGADIVNEAATAAEAYADELVGALDSSSADLFEVGEDAAYSFGEALFTGISAVLEEVKTLITSSMDDLAGANIKATANSILADLKGKIGSATANISGVTVSGSGGSSTVNNYTQIINSPKTLSRVDIYRNTKNLLGLAGGGN